MLKRITSDERKRLIELFKSIEPAVIMASLFGSYGTDYQRSDSDIDFALLFEEKPGLMGEMKILQELSAILNYENVDLVTLNDAPITLQFRAIEGDILYEKDSRQVSDMGLTLILGELARRRFASYRKITTGPQPGPAGSSNLWCEDQIRIRTGRQITRLSASRHSTHRCTARRSPGCARFVPF